MMPLTHFSPHRSVQFRWMDESSLRIANYDGKELIHHFISLNVSPHSAMRLKSKIFRAVFDLHPLPWQQSLFETIQAPIHLHSMLSTWLADESVSLESQTFSSDETLRLVLRTCDEKFFESVIIPSGPRTTVCLSSQIGCARGCSFCETAKLGLERQLRTCEIVDQFRIARRIWQSLHPDRPITNLVFMGMGEPLDNLREVARAIRLFTDPHAFAFAPSRITVSTVGVIDKLAEFFAQTQAQLAISINAPDDERRSQIMPIHQRCSLEQLKQALIRTVPPRRKLLLSYVLFENFNDSIEDADKLAEFAQGIPCRINVIPYNPSSNSLFRPPSSSTVDTFVARLAEHKITTLLRRPRGRDSKSACGQLAGAARNTSKVDLNPTT